MTGRYKVKLRNNFKLEVHHNRTMTYFLETRDSPRSNVVLQSSPGQHALRSWSLQTPPRDVCVRRRAVAGEAHGDRGVRDGFALPEAREPELAEPSVRANVETGEEGAGERPE